MTGVIVWVRVWVMLLLALSGLFTSAARPPRPLFPIGLLGGRKNVGQSSMTYAVDYFTQVIDHFSFRREASFQQRYLIEKRYWKGAADRGPIFMYCGNEGDVEWFAKNTGFLWEIAPSFGALILFPEVIIYPLSCLSIMIA